MNQVLFIIMFGGFLLLPVILLTWRMLNPKTIPWWLAFLLAAVIGWLFVNLTVYFYFEYLSDLVDASGQNPSQELLDRLTDDGAIRVFALFFGWAYELVYFTFCLWIFRIIQLARRFLYHNETA